MESTWVLFQYKQQKKVKKASEILNKKANYWSRGAGLTLLSKIQKLRNCPWIWVRKKTIWIDAEAIE